MLEFNGERFVPGHAECVREIWLEHWHRYAFATLFSQDKVVLDVACGEGYGSALLSRNAASVTAVDLSAETIAHAQSRYGSLQKLQLLQADATSISLPDKSIDLAVSFETIEHIEDQSGFLVEMDRLLKDDGLLVISSPDKAVYSDAHEHDNPFHTHEMYREEFEAFLKTRFSAVQMFEQALLFQSVIWRQPDQTMAKAQATTQHLKNWQLEQGLDYPAPYVLAVCARSQQHLPSELLDLHCFGDAEQSYQQHYNEAVGELIQFQKWGQTVNQQLQQNQALIEQLQLENQQLKEHLKQID